MVCFVTHGSHLHRSQDPRGCEGGDVKMEDVALQPHGAISFIIASLWDIHYKCVHKHMQYISQRRQIQTSSFTNEHTHISRVQTVFITCVTG